MKYLNKVLAVAGIGGAIGAGCLITAALVANHTPTFNTRWNDAVHDLATAPPSSIPPDQLRQRGMEILREKLVAKDEAQEKEQ